MPSVCLTTFVFFYVWQSKLVLYVPDYLKQLSLPFQMSNNGISFCMCLTTVIASCRFLTILLPVVLDSLFLAFVGASSDNVLCLLYVSGNLPCLLKMSDKRHYLLHGPDQCHCHYRCLTTFIAFCNCLTTFFVFWGCLTTFIAF